MNRLEELSKRLEKREKAFRKQLKLYENLNKEPLMNMSKLQAKRQTVLARWDALQKAIWEIRDELSIVGHRKEHPF